MSNRIITRGLGDGQFVVTRGYGGGLIARLREVISLFSPIKLIGNLISSINLDEEL